MRNLLRLLSISLVTIHCGGGDGSSIEANKGDIAAAVANALCDRAVEIESCTQPDGLPWCITSTTNHSKCVADETARYILKMTTNSESIILADAAVLAELCVEAVLALTCEATSSTSYCHWYDGSTSACKSFGAYVRGGEEDD